MGTLLVGLIVFGIAGLAAVQIYKDNKRGKGCGAGCADCSHCPKQAGRKKAG